MAGLDKITGQILSDAEKQAMDILEAAHKEAEKILDEAKNACEAMTLEASEKEKSIKVLEEGRTQSSMEQQKKIEILRAKQEMIREVINEAYVVLKNQNVKEYFATIKQLIRTYAFEEVGEIYFSKEDLERMPAGFEDEILATAKEAGGSLRLMKEPRPIEDGFVLVYGGIEENCTFRALMDAKKDQLQDTVNQILFG